MFSRFSSSALRAAVLAPLAAAALLACSKPAPPPEDVRPVRVTTLAVDSAGERLEFSGDVRPRYESQLGFRVGGKIVERKVDVGATVRRGDVLMRLDPQDLRLAETQARATLRAAETERDLARADYKRHVDLRAQNFVSQAVLDTKQSALKAAQANVDAARAGLRGQANQSNYTSLTADADGVVTAIEAEVGQVVQPGSPVVRVARTVEKEVVIGIPEDKVGQLRAASDVTVRLWANEAVAIPGKIREVSPVADPATRTYTVKVALPESAEVRLGMTATVELATSGNGAAGLRLPLTALVQQKGASAVWIVENGAVKLVPVQVVGQVRNDVLVTGQLGGQISAGQKVVTAGVNLLKNGQKVRILTADVSRRADTEALVSGEGRK
ncbi:efflux RND transporter periplasmic adaptor subunit [Massilia timonae]|uniref:Efflux transporter, RND family, MFP subunit n=1 Tax=Massilia timonae CCUG 45783 TaxID=883126 RepID=K9DLX5_9BURK|nr:efflux RND transporter periplasmic adaptor subunit [Massilia timonae]EKU79802.1 efflux transporter, RND family, MFP subunit [Massilia timonae CCUG 45783]